MQLYNIIYFSPSQQTESTQFQIKIMFLLGIHTCKSTLNTNNVLSATCSFRAESSVMESLLKFADKPGLYGAKLRLSQVV